MSKKPTPANTLEDLESLYSLALAKGNLTAALRAKELLGKSQGLFTSPVSKKPLSMADLSDEDLGRLIQEIDTTLEKNQENEENSHKIYPRPRTSRPSRRHAHPQ